MTRQEIEEELNAIYLEREEAFLRVREQGDQIIRRFYGKDVFANQRSIAGNVDRMQSEKDRSSNKQ